MIASAKVKLRTTTEPDILSLEDIEPAEMIKQLDVTNLATNAGQSNIPPSDAKGLDLNEQSFVREHRQLAEKAKRDYSEHNRKVEARRQQALAKLEPTQFALIEAEAKETIARLKYEKVDGLKQAQEEKSKALRALRKFKADRDIVRDAEYPESPALGYSIVGATGLLEAIANAGFFAEGSDIGLIGGAQQAVTVAAANVGLSFFAGKSLRGFHTTGLPRYLAAATAVAFPAWSAAYNLVVGAYRNALMTAPQTAATQAIKDFLENPLAPLGDFNSILLILAGIGCGAIAAWKGYKSDDKIPGFGQVDRKYRSAEENFKAKKQELYGATQSAKEAAEDKITEVAKSADEAFQTFCATTNELQQSSHNYESILNAINGSLAAVIRHYREHNTKVRTTQPPKYFNAEAPKLNLNDSQLDNIDALTPDDAIERGREKLDALKPEAVQSSARLKKLFTDQIKALPAYFEALDDDASPRAPTATGDPETETSTMNHGLAADLVH